MQHAQRAFGTPAAALRWGQANLPPDTPAYVAARGILRTASGDREAGTLAWVSLSEFTRAQYLDRELDGANAAQAELLFLTTRIVLRWRA